jgi:hypothetical protein
MDIFFTVATLAVAVIAILMIIALVYFIRVLRTLERIAGDVEGEAKAIIKDLDGVREKVRVEGFKLAHVISLLSKTGKRLITKGRRR